MELTPEERLFAAMLRNAIRDATRHTNEHVRAEAARWLWSVAPTIAQRVGLPTGCADQREAVAHRRA